ncbi:hypothetical protein RJ640_002229 [Escallonia rubra]|uniref:Uncharacterized protein n=1 Tax=Escallonia rubra TaxID=112253 RepID=A0AA88RDI5_9ASTE|nr:hypothetical protein RJ640_002229 [Escallonia rubra]
MDGSLKVRNWLADGIGPLKLFHDKFKWFNEVIEVMVAVNNIYEIECEGISKFTSLCNHLHSYNGKDEFPLKLSTDKDVRLSPIQLGMFPMNLFTPRSRKFNFVQFFSDRESSPERLLLATFKSKSRGNENIEVGISPEKWLKGGTQPLLMLKTKALREDNDDDIIKRSKLSKFDNSPMDAGIGPVIKLPSSEIDLNFLKCPIESGSCTLSRLPANDSSSKLSSILEGLTVCSDVGFS